MRIDRFMDLCLAHPEHGYYRTRDPLGTKGDFITAPEISQMFGEMLGLWIAQVWTDQGQPSPFALTELGPGRGTLMADVLRVAKRVPGFHEAAEIWLVETSPDLRVACKVALPNVDLNFADTLADVPRLPLFLLANEFFDALPIRQFQKIGDQWLERCVGHKASRLEFVLSKPHDDGPKLNPAALPDGTVVETQSYGQAVAATIGTRLKSNGGAALIIDYGAAEGHGDTLQALRAHAPQSPLENCGQADITAHVAFQSLIDAAQVPHDLDAQGPFLERLGVTTRANQLANDPTKFQDIAAAHRRLTHADEMGHLFKVLALRAPGTPQPPGFGS